MLRNGIPRVFCSAEWFRTEFREFFVPRNSRNSIGNNHLFRLFRPLRNNFRPEIAMYRYLSNSWVQQVTYLPVPFSITFRAPGTVPWKINDWLFAGKGVRQVTRLLRLIYRRRHFFFIHVDETSNWMFSQLEHLNKYINIRSTKIIPLKRKKQRKKERKKEEIPPKFKLGKA